MHGAYTRVVGLQQVHVLFYTKITHNAIPFLTFLRCSFVAIPLA